MISTELNKQPVKQSNDVSLLCLFLEIKYRCTLIPYKKICTYNDGFLINLFFMTPYKVPTYLHRYRIHFMLIFLGSHRYIPRYLVCTKKNKNELYDLGPRS